MRIEQLSTVSESRDELVALLNDCVADGASVGFVAPLETGEAERYWQEVDDGLAKGERTLLVAREGCRIAGAVQIHYCPKKNGRHRAEVEKLMVHTAFRQRGIGRQLMTALESRARAHQRTLLVLDTRSDDTASLLYRKLGYQEAGRIPRFALSSDGVLNSTTLFYKLL
ncbi:GNAT family N-acetyltransferase [Paludibacterium paludis]|uniref:N-acetyltransferase n=1 Tax=Paludibacterium paludis TaxID=1225769 RepID=A0A918UBJ7_9NEIS|nr:GNAT family N-acetyltransferase [Paludibacterium paludis]GGY23452.1 N-acetyltransferase [Paludibacterium paludis]